MSEASEAKEKLDAYLEIHDDLILRCEEWLDAFVYMGRDLYDIMIKVNNEAYPPYILADYSYRNFGEHSHDGRGEEKIPLSIMWDFECVEKERKKRQDKQFVELRKSEERRKVQDMKNKATRYEQYLTLSEEFDEKG